VQNQDIFYSDRWINWDEMKKNGPTARHTRRIILNLLRKIKFKSVLDVSCGGGHLLNEIQKKFSNVDLYGTEFIDFAVDMNKNRYRNIEFYKLDISSTSLDNNYDLVLLIDVLEHIENDDKALNNLIKMTRKYLLISVPLGPLFEKEKKLLGHVHGYKKSNIDNMLLKAGLIIKESKIWGYPFYNLVRRFSQIPSEFPAEGSYSMKKKFFAIFLYYLYFLSLPKWGERYFVLCEK